MRFDKTGFSISPGEQITCKISRSRLVIRSDKRNRHALQLSVNCHDREMLYRHLQNALAVIFIMDAHNDNSVHPQLAQSFNSGCFSVFSSIRANQHHPKALIPAFHFDTSKHLASKIRPESVQHNADYRRMIRKRFFFCNAPCRYFQCLWRFLVFDHERPLSGNPRDQSFLCKKLHRFFAGDPAHMVLFRQLFFRRKPVPDLISSFFNFGSYFLINLFIKWNLFHGYLRPPVGTVQLCLYYHEQKNTCYANILSS